MTDANTPDIKPRKKRRDYGGLAWWVIDADHLKWEIDGYGKVGPRGTGRFSSMSWMVYTAVLCLIFVVILHGGTPELWANLMVCSFLAALIYDRQKWAMMGAMVYASVLLIFLLIDGDSERWLYRVFGTFMWWTLVMKSSYRAYVVERKHQELLASQNP